MKEKQNIGSRTVLKKQDIVGKEVIDNMKQRKVIGSLIGMVLVTMAVLLMTLIFHVPAQGASASNCSILSSLDDTDCDGFLNTEEQTGITLKDSTTFVGSNSGAQRAGRLDAPTKDLFVVTVPLTSGSLFPTDPLASLSGAASEIGITTHKLSTTQVSSNRNVTTRQRAIKVVESATTGGNFGLTVNPGWGAANLPDTSLSQVSSTIYSKQISNWLLSNCPSPGCSVWDNPSVKVTQDYLTQELVKHVIAHESGHQMKLRGINDQTYGYHYAPCGGSGTCNPTIMQQSIYIDSNKVVWFGKHYQANANYGTPANYKSPTEDADSVSLLNKYCYYSQTGGQTKTGCSVNTDCNNALYKPNPGACIYP
jgi:hypothetical protein